MPRQIYEFPFSGGIDEKTQAELVGAPSVITRSNLVQTKSGALQKPAGWSSVVNTILGGGTISSAARGLAYRGEIDITDGQQLYAYGAAAGAWRQVGQISEPAVRRFPIAGAREGVSPTSWDIGYANGFFIVAAYTTVVALYVIDASTGAVVSRATGAVGAGATTRVRVSAFGTTAFVVYDGSATSISITQLDLTNPTATGWTTTTAASDKASGSDAWDICTLTDRFALVYMNNSGAFICLTAKTFNAAGLITSTTRSLVTNVLGSVGIGGNKTDQIWVAYQTFPQNNNLNVFALDPVSLASLASNTLVVGAALVPIAIGVVSTGLNTGYVVASYRNSQASGAQTSGLLVYKVTLSAGTITPSVRLSGQGHLAVQGRPFTQNGRIFAAVSPVSGSDPQNSSTNGGVVGPNYWVVDVTDFPPFSPRPVASLAPRLYSPVSHAPSDASEVPTHIAQVGTNKWAVLYRVTTTAQSAGLEIATLDFTPRDQWCGAAYGDLMTIGCAVPSVYDGTDLFEANMLAAPEVYLESKAAGVITGTYAYTAIYEHFDGRSWVAWSQNANPISGVSLSSQQATIRVSVLAVTMRVGMRAVLYRTKTLGSAYFRVPGSETLVNGTDHVSIVDNIADASLGALLYIQPGTTNTALARQAPPAFLHAIQHSDRVIGLAHPRTLWPSSELVDGEEPWWSDATQMEVPSRLPLAALASIDGRLVVFSPEEVGFIDGAGPADNGTSNDYSPVQWIATDIGCVDWRSVCVCSLGVIFRSRVGIELLNRSMQIENFFGRAVENELATYPTITSTVVNEAEGRVYFTCVDVDGAPTAGIILVYDLIHGTWGTIPTPIEPVISACVVGNDPALPVKYTTVFAGAVSGAIASQQSATKYTDVFNAFVPSTVRTPWIKLAGLQGYIRLSTIYLLAKSLTPHDLRVDLYFDYSTSIGQTVIFTAAQIAAFTTPLAQIAIDPVVQKIEAVQAVITDASPTGGPALGTGQGPALLGMRFEYSVKPGGYRAPAAQTA